MYHWSNVVQRNRFTFSLEIKGFVQKFEINTFIVIPRIANLFSNYILNEQLQIN